MLLSEKLSQGPVICAEGYLFELERRGYVKAGPFVPEVVLDHPEAVKELHREFLRCGSDIIEAFTYYAHRDKMKVIGREGDIENLNRQALRIAKEIALEGNALMAGNICNTWAYDHNNPEETGNIVRSMFDEQVRWAKEEGADFVIGETFSHLGEARIALEVIKQHGFEAVITFASNYGQTLDGHEYADACKILEDEGALVVGLNCTRGAPTMLPLIRKIRERCSGHIAALPVPYRTTEQEESFQQLKDKDGNRGFPVNLDPFRISVAEAADFAGEAREIGVNYLGLCCGAAPNQIRAIAERLGRTVPASRYSPDMSKHAVLGSDDVVRGYNKEKIEYWKDQHEEKV